MFKMAHRYLTLEKGKMEVSKVRWDMFQSEADSPATANSMGKLEGGVRKLNSGPEPPQR